ncbi:MAG: hypothetical protein LC739_04180 [Actinobacteria bacterium]|nr:hypothetical protein [Actinomycetota bacterium]
MKFSRLRTLIALLLDERYGYFNRHLAALRLVLIVFVENFGLRQQTVWWRVRALIGVARRTAGAT